MWRGREMKNKNRERQTELKQEERVDFSLQCTNTQRLGRQKEALLTCYIIQTAKITVFLSPSESFI